MFNAKIKKALDNLGKPRKGKPKPRKTAASKSKPMKVKLDDGDKKKKLVVKVTAPEPVVFEPVKEPEPVAPPPPVVVELPPVPIVPQSIMQTPIISKETTPAPFVPKVDAETVVLKTHFAVAVLKGEAYRDVVRTFMYEADAQGVMFRKLQVMDILTVGAYPFVRFRSDLTPDELELILAPLRASRATISSTAAGNYQVLFPNGRTARYPASPMCALPRGHFGQIYSGTRIKRWATQFP